MPVVSDHTALLSGFDWTMAAQDGAATVVTFAFLDVREAAVYSQPFFDVAGYTAFSAALQAEFRKVVAEAARVSGLLFVEVANPADAMIDVVRASGSLYGGWADYPIFSGSTIVIDNQGSYAPGSYAYETMLHELGHALGLKHPFEGPVRLRPAFDTEDNTLMSYTSNGRGDTAYARLDVDALSEIYGRPAGRDWHASYVASRDMVVLRTGAAADNVSAGIFPDVGFEVRAGAGNDRLTAGAGASRLFGEDGNDRFFDVNPGDLGSPLRTAAYFFSGGAGNDTVTTLGENATVDGGAGFDRVILVDDAVVALGAASTPDLRLRNVEELITSDAGALVFGSRDPDRVYGGAGRDTVYAGDGDDLLWLGAGADTVYGSWGRDRLSGDEGADTLFGGADVDALYGGDGNDSLDGGTGADQLRGGAGRDLLAGGDGSVIAGGVDRDRFEITAISGLVTITDFVDGEVIVGLIATRAEFATLTFTDTTGGVRIADGALTVMLRGVTASDLDFGDFGA